MGATPARVGSTQRWRSITCATGAESDVYECLLLLAILLWHSECAASTVTQETKMCDIIHNATLTPTSRADTRHATVMTYSQWTHKCVDAKHVVRVCVVMLYKLQACNNMSGSVSMAREIPLVSNLPLTPTKDCSWEWGTVSTTCFTASSQTSPATATASDLDDITLYSQRKLMIGILLLDSYSTTFIDTVYCFYCNFLYCKQSRSDRRQIKLLIDWVSDWLIDWLSFCL